MFCIFYIFQSVVTTLVGIRNSVVKTYTSSVRGRKKNLDFFKIKEGVSLHF